MADHFYYEHSVMPINSTDGGALMPVVYLPHGGGPLPLLGDTAHVSLTQYMRSLSQLPKPAVILLISAHWEAKCAQFTASAQPDLIFDYSGFPEQCYEYRYAAPGAPEQVHTWVQRLNNLNIPAQAEPTRGWDHGCFVPLLLSHPQADIPVVQLSLLKGLDPAAHIALGEALAPLRREGVVIIGSGLSFHNMAAFFSPSTAARQQSEAFDNWLYECLCNHNLNHNEQCARLIHWQQAPSARFCHPREEHLLPLHVCLGAAAESELAERSYSDYLMGAKVSGFTWR
ncbi:MAG TPA: class III extradiol ring-cleavage dioxygenase [Cellvibrionaceae bacterium]